MPATRDGVGAMEAQLERWSKEIDWLACRTQPARLGDLLEKRERAQAKLADFKASQSQSWDSFMSGAGVAWRELEAACAKWMR